MRKSRVTKLLFATAALLIGFLCSCNLRASTSSSDSPYTESHLENCAHVYEEWTTKELPSCEAHGYEERTCSLCGKEEMRTLPALGHVEGEWTVRSQADCLNEGYAESLCARCNVTLVKKLSKLDTHELLYTSIDRAPSCTVSGYVQQHCACCQIVINTFTPSLGGHLDEDGNSVCDVCEEKVRSIPVHLRLQGNATATVADHVLLGEKSGGIISVTMGENSIFYKSYTLFPPSSDSPDFVSGNVIVIQPRTLPRWKRDALTTIYEQYIPYEQNDFGIPQEVTIEIADTTQTAVVIVEKIMLPREGNEDYFAQVFLHWGKLVDKEDAEAMSNPDNQVEITEDGLEGYYDFSHYTDEKGALLSEDATIKLLLTQSITYLYAYYNVVERSSE